MNVAIEFDEPFPFWPPVPVRKEKKKKNTGQCHPLSWLCRSNQNMLWDLNLHVSALFVTLMFMFPLISVFFSSGLLTLLQTETLSCRWKSICTDYNTIKEQTQLRLCSLWHNGPVSFRISCLSMRFLLFILLTGFNLFYDCFFCFVLSFFLDDCWFTGKGWSRAQLLPSVVHSLLCWPSKPYIEGFNMESTLHLQKAH